MIIQKGNFFRFIFKNKFIFLNLSLIILIFCAVFASPASLDSKGFLKSIIKAIMSSYHVSLESGYCLISQQRYFLKTLTQ